MVDAAPATVVIADASEDETADVPIFADTVPASVAWLLGWNVVDVVPLALVLPDAGVKL